MQGAKGDKGDKGDQGPAGPQGPIGDIDGAFDDTQVLTTKTWTSSKIKTELDSKATASSLSAVATGGKFADLTNTPTTVAGYGITDAMTTSHAANNVTVASIDTWNIAYAWGNHATQGYMKSPSPAVEGNLISYDGSNWVSKKLTLGATGGGVAVSNMQPYLTLNYCISTAGIYPSRSSDTPIVGEIDLFAFSFVPQGYVPCAGQLLNVAQYNMLFSLFGATYGGDGRTTFAVPDLRGRVVVSQRNSVDPLSGVGEKGGSESITISIQNLPSHTHDVIYK